MQQIANIGRILKILVDEFPAMQVIATGSSSFNLVNRTAEPLTGRMYRFELYPLALQELAGDQGYSAIEPRLDFLLRFGAYPSIVDLSEHEARIELDELVSNYLYRDALAFVGMGKSTVLVMDMASSFYRTQIGRIERINTDFDLLSSALSDQSTFQLTLRPGRNQFL